MQKFLKFIFLWFLLVIIETTALAQSQNFQIKLLDKSLSYNRWRGDILCSIRLQITNLSDLKYIYSYTSGRFIINYAGKEISYRDSNSDFYNNGPWRKGEDKIIEFNFDGINSIYLEYHPAKIGFSFEIIAQDVFETSRTQKYYLDLTNLWNDKWKPYDFSLEKVKTASNKEQTTSINTKNSTAEEVHSLKTDQDARYLYGKPRTENSEFKMPGWQLGADLDTDSYGKTGYIIFEVEVNDQGEVLKVNAASYSVSLKVVEFYQTQLRNESFIWIGKGNPPTKSEGKITLRFKNN